MVRRENILENALYILIYPYIYIYMENHMFSCSFWLESIPYRAKSKSWNTGVVAPRWVWRWLLGRQSMGCEGFHCPGHCPGPFPPSPALKLLKLKWSIPIDTFLVGWTSIYQLFWGSLGTKVLTNSHLWNCWNLSPGSISRLTKPENSMEEWPHKASPTHTSHS